MRVSIAARIFAIADEPLGTTDPFCGKGDSPSSLSGSIAFDSCYFSYPTRYVFLILCAIEFFFVVLIRNPPLAPVGQTSKSITRQMRMMAFLCRLLRGSLSLLWEKVVAGKVQPCR